MALSAAVLHRANVTKTKEVVRSDLATVKLGLDSNKEYGGLWTAYTQRSADAPDGRHKRNTLVNVFQPFTCRIVLSFSQ